MEEATRHPAANKMGSESALVHRNTESESGIRRHADHLEAGFRLSLVENE